MLSLYVQDRRGLASPRTAAESAAAPHRLISFGRCGRHTGIDYQQRRSLIISWPSEPCSCCEAMSLMYTRDRSTTTFCRVSDDISSLHRRNCPEERGKRRVMTSQGVDERGTSRVS